MNREGSSRVKRHDMELFKGHFVALSRHVARVVGTEVPAFDWSADWSARARKASIEQRGELDKANVELEECSRVLAQSRRVWETGKDVLKELDSLLKTFGEWLAVLVEINFVSRKEDPSAELGKLRKLFGRNLELAAKLEVQAEKALGRVESEAGVRITAEELGFEGTGEG